MTHEPDIRLTRKDGEEQNVSLVRPLGREEKGWISKDQAIEKLWWKRLAVNRLLIDKAHFISVPAAGETPTELKNVSIEAEDIRFESGQALAKIRIRYDLPQVSKQPMELNLRLAFQEATQGLQVQEGKFNWGPAQITLGGEALLPSQDRKEVALNLHFESPALDLRKLSKIMVDPLPASGMLSIKGTVTGTAFAPLLKLVLDSPALTLAGKTLANLMRNYD